MQFYLVHKMMLKNNYTPQVHYIVLLLPDYNENTPAFAQIHHECTNHYLTNHLVRAVSPFLSYVRQQGHGILRCTGFYLCSLLTSGIHSQQAMN